MKIWFLKKKKKNKKKKNLCKYGVNLIWKFTYFWNFLKFSNIRLSSDRFSCYILWQYVLLCSSTNCHWNENHIRLKHLPIKTIYLPIIYIYIYIYIKFYLLRSVIGTDFYTVLRILTSSISIHASLFKYLAKLIKKTILLLV